MASQHCVYCGKHLSETAGTAVCGSPECSRRYAEDRRLAVENRCVRTWRPEDSQPLDIDQVLSQQADFIRRMREGGAAGREADDIAVTPVGEEPLAVTPGDGECVECGTPLHGLARRYCSRGCEAAYLTRVCRAWHARHPDPGPGKCLVCGRRLPTPRHHVYCSADCRAEGHRISMLERRAMDPGASHDRKPASSSGRKHVRVTDTRVCAECGKPLPPGRRRHCSEACRHQAHRERMRAYYKTHKNTKKTTK
ncbi:hypothetical protein ACLUWO_04175 [Pseudoscardovia radai]|uniref:hypothetical protein n=1 Tax=Pseudoscardovia radai TaxID=987066 RepID=UPI0039912A61